MKKISQEEFERELRDVIDGKISRIDLAKKLETDIRTLNNKIIEEISINNPDLYIEYIKKYPYKQKERDDIDYEALVIEMVKNRTYSLDAAIKYNVGVRTIQRKVNSLEKENPYLFSIYKEVKRLNKNDMQLPIELEKAIEQLVTRPVQISEVNTTRREQLEEIERIFNNRCLYMSKIEAATSMGMSKHRIYKSLNELYRLRIEENYANMNKSFRENLRVESSQQQLEVSPEKTETHKSIQKEGEEK